MLTRDDFLSLNFVKKEDYPGSYKGLRYTLHKEEMEDGKAMIKISIWPEPFNFTVTDSSLIISELFDFNEDGLASGIAWMNEMYPRVAKK